MNELTFDETKLVGGGVDQATQIGFQGSVAATGMGLLAAGVAMSPLIIGGLLLASVVVTAAYIADR
jgi:hypothetical protein